MSVLDFDDEEEGSDLWLFAQTTHLRKHIGEMAVLLSAQGGAKVWYEVDEEERKVYLLSDRPTKVSYRLTAPRFDAEEWTNYNTDGIMGFQPPSGDDLSYFDEEDIEFAFANIGTTTLASLIEEAAGDNPWDGVLADASDGLKTAMEVVGDAVIEAYEGVRYITDGIFKRVFAGEVYTDKICVTDEGGSTCLTRADLDALIAGAAASMSDGDDEETEDESGGGGGAGGGGEEETGGGEEGEGETGGEEGGEPAGGEGEGSEETGGGETGENGGAAEGETGGETSGGEESGGESEEGSGEEEGGGEPSESGGESEGGSEGGSEEGGGETAGGEGGESGV
jgi:hypothetical protein